MKNRFKVSLLIIVSVFGIVSCSSRHAADKPDTTIPTILSTTPADNATAVAVNTAITVTFSKAMNAASINSTSFRLMSSATATIAGTVTYDPASNVAIFTPVSVLNNDTTYNAVLDSNVKDLAGNALSFHSWAFTTIPASGTLDATFGSNGKIRTPLGNADDIAMAAVIQQDGMIVTAGYSTAVNSNIIAYNFTVARFQPNGKLDDTFGLQQNGIGTSFPGTARTVGLQSDGKIVAAGDNLASKTTPTCDFLIARYNTDGTLDINFASSGLAMTAMGFDTAEINSLAIQTDGKIVVAGHGYSSTDVSLLARYNTDGSLDKSFASNGTCTIQVTNSAASLAAVVKIQTDGKILVGGYFQGTSGPQSIYLARYDSNGSPDALFNSSGIVTASTGTDSILTSINILPDGTILVAGTTNIGSDDLFLMKFNADGTSLSLFGSSGNGMVITDDVNQGVETAAGLAVQADGKIIVAATFNPSSGLISDKDFALFRYDANGTLDTTTFGNGHGMVTTDFGNNYDEVAKDVQIQPDGKIVVVGKAWNGSNYDIGISRYWP